jgi:hypothetical protein
MQKTKEIYACSSFSLIHDFIYTLKMHDWEGYLILLLVFNVLVIQKISRLKPIITVYCIMSI